jgi:drug/metabolite transporter (DMT)-like permease
VCLLSSYFGRCVFDLANPMASPAPSSSSSPFYYELLICIGTTLYGISVVTSRAAMNHGIGPATFNSLQHIVASLSLILLRPLLKKLTAHSSPIPHCHTDTTLPDTDTTDTDTKSRESLPIIQWFESHSPLLKNNSSSFELIFLSLLCASLNFIASSFNQYGLVTVEAGKSAFLTSLYVGFTPIILYLLHGSKAQISLLTWLSALVSLFGSYLLAGCDKSSLFDSLTLGEIYTIIGALLWAFVILMTDYAVDRVDCIDLVCLELTFSTVFCLLLMVCYEPDGLEPLLHYNDDDTDTTSRSMSLFVLSWCLIVATGAIEALAFLLDTIGQIHTSGSRAALLMGLDSVVTVSVAYFFLHERLSYLETLGCVLLLSSTLLTTLGSSDDDEEEEIEDGDEEEGEEEDELLELESNRPPLLLPGPPKKKSNRSHSPVPYHRIKSSAQFAGEIRQQSYVFMSRRGLPVRTGRRERSNSLHETSHTFTLSSSSRRVKGQGHPATGRGGSTPSATSLSSSLPNSMGYGLTGDLSSESRAGLDHPRDDGSQNVTLRATTKRTPANESSPLL